MNYLTKYSLLAVSVVGLSGVAVADHHGNQKAKHGDKPAHPSEQEDGEEEKWIQLFNGKNLEGWTPKFNHEEVGVNYKETFRVVDGKLVVDYSNWDGWEKDKFGHLFYDKEFGHYRLRAEYRFVDQQIKGAPGWANRNNGLMIHGQTPEEMNMEQKFPDSIEVQLLGGMGKGKRPTLNLFTPGTKVKTLKGEKWVTGNLKSSGPTFHGEEWVTVEVEVHGSGLIQHKVNGKVVNEYTSAHYDDGTPIEAGTISIQAETSPVEFRKIELLPLHGDAVQ